MIYVSLEEIYSLNAIIIVFNCKIIHFSMGLPQRKLLQYIKKEKA